MISYEIIISTTEYRNDVSVRTDTSVWHRRYKSRKTAERKAAEKIGRASCRERV